MSQTTSTSTSAPIDLTDGERDLVQTVRSFARQRPFPPSAESPTRGGFDRAFSALLGEHGWTGMTIPTEYGGSARTSVERCLVISELLAAGAPLGAHWTADRQTAASLLINGPDSLRQELLPKIAAGRCLMAGGFSEPDAGSDLASVRTRAHRVDGGWRINGRKIWTSDAERADYIEVLCRTSDASRKHQGLSLIVVPMTAEGIAVHPIESMDGERHFNEVVLDDVFAPDGWLIGTEGSGWQQLTAELALERAGPERYLTTFPLFEAFVASRAGSADPAREAMSHQLIGSVIAAQMGLRHMSLSIARLVDRGGSPVAEAAMAKDLGTELEQLLVDDLWAYRNEPLPAGEATDRFHTFLDINRLRSAVMTTAGGTNEVLRLLVSRQLGEWSNGRKSWALRSPFAETVFDMATSRLADAALHSVPRTHPDAASTAVAADLGRAGFLGVSVAEELGGSGGSLSDAIDVTVAAAYAGVSLPLIEGPILAGWLLASAGIEHPWNTELAVLGRGSVIATVRDGEVVLNGTLDPIAWGAAAGIIVIPVAHRGSIYVATVATADLSASSASADIAGQPELIGGYLDGVRAQQFRDTGRSADDIDDVLRRRAALARASAIAGALQRTAEISIGFAEQRVQFGQPIARFQAIQTYLTRLASEAQRVAVLVDAARLHADDPDGPPFALLAASKTLAGLAATTAARTAHQIHGAIGVTMEYALQRFTRRLWSWQLQDGSSEEWARALGARACELDLGPWRLITSTD